MIISCVAGVDHTCCNISFYRTSGNLRIPFRKERMNFERLYTYALMNLEAKEFFAIKIFSDMRYTFISYFKQL